MLPERFKEILTESLGEQTASELLPHLEASPSVSVRPNTAKISTEGLRGHFAELYDGPVDWSPESFYLSARPSFTLDPLFHTGAYYVQEAASMYVGHLLEGILAEGRPIRRLLDLCAAPGGKTTDILSRIPDDSLLVTNEVKRGRATILAENVAKWGRANVLVTNNDPADFKGLDSWFDFVLVDAPCSGEGMFRKDDEAVEDWSEDNVRLCAARQRRILSDIWPALREGGYMIYSTCTFNHFEDEDNAAWIASELGAEILQQRHFLPGRERGEGFYCALLRKSGESAVADGRASSRQRVRKPAPAPDCDYVREGYTLALKGDLLKAYPASLMEDMQAVEASLKVIHSGVAVATVKGRDLIPEADLALSCALREDAFPRVELSREDALRFLAKEPLAFPQEPRGYLMMTYCGLPLGFVKNLGNRSNNLHPMARRIRKSIN